MITFEDIVRDALVRATGFIPNPTISDAVFLTAQVISDHLFNLKGTKA